MTEIELRSEEVFRRFRRVMLASRRDVLAKIASMPEAASAERKRWLYRSIEDIDGMLKGSGYSNAAGKWVIRTPGLADRIAAELPAKRLYGEAAGKSAGQFGVAMPLTNPQILKFAAEYEFPWLQNAKNLADDVRNRVEQAIRLGVAQGESVSQVAKRIAGAGLRRGAYDTVMQRARTMARTETAVIINEGTLGGYRVVEVEQVICVGRTTKCAICGALLGRVFDIDKAPRLPAHPCCVHGWAAYSRRGVKVYPG